VRPTAIRCEKKVLQYPAEKIEIARGEELTERQGSKRDARERA